MTWKGKILTALIAVVFTSAVVWAGTFTSYNDITDMADGDMFLIYDASEGSGDYLANITWANLKLEMQKEAIGPVIAIKSAAYTIGTDDIRECYGGIIYVTGAAVITYPAVGVRMHFTIKVIGAVAVSGKPNANDKQCLDGTWLDDADKVTSTSTTGDLLVVTYYDATGWDTISGSNDGDPWTDTGA